jgi:hypothetical protein
VSNARKLILGAGALLLPLTTVLALGSIPASAKGKSAQPGTVTCSTVTGSFKFSPALTVAGGASETITSKTTLTGCKATGGVSPSKGTTSVTTVDPSNACQAVLEGAAKPETLTTKWSPGTIEPSVVSFPAPKSSEGPPITFSLGGSGTTGTGSYMGTNGGATSSATVDIEGTVASLTSACEGKKGLKGLTINAGTATVS